MFVNVVVSSLKHSLDGLNAACVRHMVHEFFGAALDRPVLVDLIWASIGSVFVGLEFRASPPLARKRYPDPEALE